jgi:CRP-like cAMP-binding protein/sugar phosphate isomerase/epimerase
VLLPTFWSGELWHPAAYLQQAYERNLQGVEYYIDFHPFQVSLNKLLPEDFNDRHRELIREWVERTHLELSIHSAVVGPYSTPTFMGQQLYYDPVDAMEVQKETILLAQDIGAPSVVLHLVDPHRLPELAELIETAAGSQVRVTVENYYYTEKIQQTSEQVIEVLNDLLPLLSAETRRHNFGITFDPGHYNIEGDDPIIAALRMSQWCRDQKVNFTKIHATTNYGPLRCFPPNFSSDVHDRVSHIGINNQLVTQIVRWNGYTPLVTAEQLHPLTERDIRFIDDAQTAPLEQEYASIVQRGKALLAGQADELLTPADTTVEAYQFIVGLLGLEALQRYLVYRQIQRIAEMTVETAEASTLLLMKASLATQRQALRHLPTILQAAIAAEGGVSQHSIGAICTRLRDALLVEIQRDYLNLIFADSHPYYTDETICQEGAIDDAMFYIKHGQAQVFISGVYMATLEAGEIFGEMSLFYGIPRSATVKASANDTEIGLLTRECLVASLHHREGAGKTILHRLYSLLPERLRNLDIKYSQALQLLQSRAPSRAAALANTTVDANLELDTAFETMRREELDKLFRLDRVYAPGEVVFPQDTVANGAYLVKSGAVRVIRHNIQRLDSKDVAFIDTDALEKMFRGNQFYSASASRAAEDLVLARLGSKEIIGEVALIDESDRSATIVSEGATLGYMTKEDFDQIIATDAAMSNKFLLTLCSSMMSRIDRLNQEYLHVLSEIRRH